MVGLGWMIHTCLLHGALTSLYNELQGVTGMSSHRRGPTRCLVLPQLYGSFAWPSPASTVRGTALTLFVGAHACGLYWYLLHSASSIPTLLGSVALSYLVFAVAALCVWSLSASGRMMCLATPWTFPLECPLLLIGLWLALRNVLFSTSWLG